MAKDSVMKSVIREVVKEELNKGLSFRFSEFEEKILGSIQNMLADFRSDMAKMKLEILGELQKTREEQVLPRGNLAVLLTFEKSLLN